MSSESKSPYYTKSFSVSKENERDIYNHLIEVEKNKKITEYIKELIRKDMSGGFNDSNQYGDISEAYIKKLVDKLVEEKLNSLDIKITDNEETVDSQGIFNEESTLSIENEKSIEKENIPPVKQKSEEPKKKKKIPFVDGVMG